jgi:hypothetical protein
MVVQCAYARADNRTRHAGCGDDLPPKRLRRDVGTVIKHLSEVINNHLMVGCTHATT